jgi:hypothetical protein
VTVPGWLGLGALAGLLAGWALFGHGKAPEVPAATVAQIAALRADSARFRAFQDSAVKSAAGFLASARSDTARMAVLAASAARSGHRADSLAAVAARFPVPPDDSAAAYFRDAYQERSREADSLRTANGLAFQAMRGAMATANICLKAQIEAEGRLSQSEQVNRDLEGVIAKSRKPSRLSLAVAAGYGAMASGGQVRTGPAVLVGLAYSLRFPRLF